MMKTLTTILAIAALTCNVLAGSFRVHYSIKGSGRDITVLAESSSEARRTVMDIIPGAVVTNVRKIK
jgi:hypothetical protein